MSTPAFSGRSRTLRADAVPIKPLSRRNVSETTTKRAAKRKRNDKDNLIHVQDIVADIVAAGGGIAAIMAWLSVSEMEARRYLKHVNPTHVEVAEVDKVEKVDLTLIDEIDEQEVVFIYDEVADRRVALTLAEKLNRTAALAFVSEEDQKLARRMQWSMWRDQEDPEHYEEVLSAVEVLSRVFRQRGGGGGGGSDPFGDAGPYGGDPHGGGGGGGSDPFGGGDPGPFDGDPRGGGGGGGDWGGRNPYGGYGGGEAGYLAFKKFRAYGVPRDGNGFFAVKAMAAYAAELGRRRR